MVFNLLYLCILVSVYQWTSYGVRAINLVDRTISFIMGSSPSQRLDAGAETKYSEDLIQSNDAIGQSLLKTNIDPLLVVSKSPTGSRVEVE
jgi:hypothetical protein